VVSGRWSVVSEEAGVSGAKRACRLVVSEEQWSVRRLIDNHREILTRHELTEVGPPRTTGARNLYADCSVGRATRRASVLAARLIS
jgi:hypothetical protein